MDDIINIKFQRWFPESIQNNHCLSASSLESRKLLKENLLDQGAGISRSIPSGETDFVSLSNLPEAQVNNLSSYATNYHFDAFENTQFDSSLKKSSRSQTMETIVETEDTAPTTPEKNNDTDVNVSRVKGGEGAEIILTSNLGSTLNKYLKLNETEDNKNKKKKVTINDNARSESSSSGIATMIEECENTSKIMSRLMSEPEDIGPEHSEAISKIMEDENAACILKYIGNGVENKTVEQSNDTSKFQLPKNGESEGLNNADILSWIGSSNNNVSLHIIIT